MADLAPQYLEWVRNNPNTAAAAVMLSAVHAIGIQQGFEISGHQLLMDCLRTLGVAPLAGDAISSIMQGVASVINALYQEYRRRGEAAIGRAATDELREIIGRTLTALRPALTYQPTVPIPPQMPDPYVPHRQRQPLDGWHSKIYKENHRLRQHLSGEVEKERCPRLKRRRQR